MNRSGELLICERIDNPGSWQFPQGGVDRDESLEQALIREVYEEVGLPASDYRILAQHGPYHYGFPSGKSKRGFDGQQQTVFLAECHKDRPLLSLDHHQQEFIDTHWIRPATFQINWVPEFKQQLFSAIFRDLFDITLDKS